MFDSKALLACGAAVALASACTSSDAGAASPPRPVKPPVIKTHAENVMVDHRITLKGKNFPSNFVIHLRECGRTFWLEPNEPCNTVNEATVTTDAKGRFSVSFYVELCPEGEPGEIVTQRTCYIGEPQFGEDTGMLGPVVKIKGTYP